MEADMNFTDPDIPNIGPREAKALLKLPNSTFYRLIREGKLPPGRLISERIRRWTRNELLNARMPDSKHPRRRRHDA